MIHIKDISGNIILSVSISQECEHVEELMKSDYIQLSWSSDNSDTIPAGSYIEYKGEKYSLLEPYSPKRKDEAEFIYQPQFQSKIMIWGKTPFFMYTYTDDVITNREPDWSLTDNPANFMSVVVDAIKNETGEVWTYSVESSLPASTTQSFQSIDIFSALNQIANTFETEWWVDKVNKVIHLSKASHGDPVVLEVGENVNTPSVTSSKEGYYTRFYAFGSTRNIVQDYKGANVNNLVNKRLTLDPVKYPGGYKDIRDNLSSDEIFSKVLILDDIYPSSKLKISDVRVRLMWTIDPDTKEKVQIGTDNEGNPIYDQYAIWYFQIPGFFFDNTAYDKDTNPQGMLIPGKTLSAHFQNGPLSGREFELKYHDKAESVDSADGAPIQIKKGDYEILFVKEDSLVIPMINNLVPADGNEVVLFNIRMPEEYTTSAYLDLESALNKEIERLSSDLNNYQFNSNPVAFDNSNPKLSLGRNITYKNGTYSYSTRVIKLVTKLDFEIEQTITVGNEQIKGNTQEIKEEIASANKDINLLAILNSTTNSLTQAYSRTQQLMLEGFASIKDMWKFDPDNADTIFSKYNVYSKKALSAKGLAEGSGGSGGGASALYQLVDVIANSTGTGVEGVADGYVLAYDALAGKWKAAQRLDETALKAYLTTNKYATHDWVEGKGYLTQHQSLANYVTLNTAQEITGDKTFFSSNGNLRTVINGRDIITVHNSNYVGGWTRGLIFRRADGATNYGTFGAYGSDQALNYLYIGQNYASPWITFNDTLVKSNIAFEASSIRKTDGTSTQFLKADGSIDSNSYLTTVSASSTYVRKAGDIMTGALTVPNLVISSTEGVKHIAFSRDSYNYITTPANALLAFVMNNKVTDPNNADFIITNNGIYSGGTGVVTNGTNAHRWSNVYSVLGNFSGVITAGSSINAAGTINSGGNVNAENYIVTKKGWFQNDSVGGGLYNKGGDARWFYDGFQWYADKAVLSISTITGTRLVSNIANGTAPLIVSSSTMVNNLNSQYLGGYDRGRYVYHNAYSNTNGCLVRLTARATEACMITVHIIGNSYNAKNVPIDTTIQFYNYPPENKIVNPSAVHNGYNFGSIDVFNYDGQVYLWFKQTGLYQSFSIIARYTNGNGNYYGVNVVESITNAAKPTAEVTRSVTITPSVSALLTDNVASATKLANSRRIFGQLFDGTTDVSGEASGVTRVSNTSGSNLFLGNSDNTGFVQTSNMCASTGTTYWSLRTTGVGHFRRINLGDVENDDSNYRLAIAGNVYINGHIISPFYRINYSNTNPYYSLTKGDLTAHFQISGEKAYVGFGINGAINITQDGKVGIGLGATTPSYRLHVNGDSYFNGSLIISVNNGKKYRISVNEDYNGLVISREDGTVANLVSTGGMSAKGYASGSGGSGGGLIQNVYGYDDLGKSYSSTDYTNTFNADTTNRLAARIASLEGGSALNFVTAGTGEFLKSVSKSGTTVTFTKGTPNYINSSTTERGVKPNATGNGLLKLYFLTAANVGLASGYADCLFLNSYVDSSGGGSNLISFSKTNGEMGLHYQSFNSTTWGARRIVLESVNYTNYTVTKTGGGASGSWGINITGNAATATSATTANSSNVLTVTKNFDPANLEVDALKVKAYDSYTIANTPSTYGNVLEINGIGGHWKPQLWFDGSSTGSVRHRNRNYNATSWGAWYTLLDTNNYATTLNSTYVRKSGDTMTGGLIVPNLTSSGTINVGGNIVVDNWVRFSISGAGLYNEVGGARWYWDGSSWHSDKPVFVEGTITGTRLMSNVAQGTSPLVVTSTTQVANLNADLHDGYHASESSIVSSIVARDSARRVYLSYINSDTNRGENGVLDQFICTNSSDNFYRKYGRDYVRVRLNDFINNCKTLDLTSLDQNTYYPCSVTISAKEPTTINIFVSLNSSSKPSWSTHVNGFTMNLSWQVFGGGWGTTAIQRKIFNYYISSVATGVQPCGGIEQNAYASTEIVYLRGGAKYLYTISNSTSAIAINTNGYTWSSGNYSYSAPTMSAPKKHPSLCYEASSMLGVYNLYSSYLQTGSISVDGTVTAATYKSGKSMFQDGQLELSGATPYIDFHYGSSTADYTHRIIAETSDRLNITTGLQVNGVLYGKGNLNIGSTIVSNVEPTGTNTWSNLSTLSPVLAMGSYSVAKDSVQPMFRWANQIPEGYITRYIIGSHRPSSAGFGQLRFWVGNNDAGTTGNWLALNHDGVVSTSLTYFETSNTGFKTGNVVFGAKGSVAEISSATNHLLVSGYSDIHVNYTVSGTGRAIPTKWYWHRGAANTWADFEIGLLTTHSSAYLGGDVTISDDLIVNGSSTFAGHAIAALGLDVIDLAYLQDDLQVDGYSSFNSDVTINANLGMMGTIDLIGGTIRGDSSSKIICDGIGISTGNKESGCIISGNPSSWNIAFDHNDIQARNNGIMSVLYLNDYGGDVSITNASSAYGVKILSTKASTSYSNGALTVGGGIGVGGSIYTRGSVIADGAISAKSASDQRLKTNFDRNVRYDERLLSLGCVLDYNYNDLALQRGEGGVDRNRHTGLIYQNVEKIMPHITYKSADGYGSINYISPDFIATIAGATQLNTLGLRSVVRKAESLESRINALEKENEKLKSEIKRLGGRI